MKPDRDLATNPTAPDSAAIPRRIMSRMRLTVIAGLLALLAVCLIFAWSTRDAMANLPFLKGASRGHAPASGQNTLVDIHPWQTAQALAPLAVTAEEIGDLARDAERLADHEVDQAFASALRQASTPHRSLTPEAQRGSQKKKITFSSKPSSNKIKPPLVPSPRALPVQHRRQAFYPMNSNRRSRHRQSPARSRFRRTCQRPAGVRSRLRRSTHDCIQQELNAHEAVMRKYDSQFAIALPHTALLSAQQYGTLVGTSECVAETDTLVIN